MIDQQIERLSVKKMAHGVILTGTTFVDMNSEEREKFGTTEREWAVGRKRLNLSVVDVVEWWAYDDDEMPARESVVVEYCTHGASGYLHSTKFVGTTEDVEAALEDASDLLNA